MITLELYQSTNGDVPFNTWFDALRDQQACSRILTRLDKVKRGAFGDCKSLGGGLFELRIDYGPGYRMYYGMVGKAVVLLLCGGDKRKQNADIERARAYFDDYKRSNL